MPEIKIAIADDYTIFRDGLKVGLLADENLEVILEADNGEELLKGMQTYIPDVIIMDLKMPVMDGMKATKLVREKYPAVKVLVVSMYDDDKFITRLLETGANGYLLKNAEPEEILMAVYAVHENGYYFNDHVNKTLLKKLVTTNALYPVFNQNVTLTETEQQALKIICADNTTNETARETAATTDVSEDTRRHLYKKIGVRNNAGLVMYAVKNGLIS
jgi:DNA-binding NarL/FixJ family response regulator